MQFVAIIGSVMSGLGKGVLTASLALSLKKMGNQVSIIKFDGYLNYDCGTINPYKHGEVFVLEDGSEVDMDFGTYERFLNINIDGKSSLTGGKIFKTIIEMERKGLFLGDDVQFIPHLTNYIKAYLKEIAKGSEITFIEVGGTVGDLENSYFLEALRQLSLEENVIFVQLTYIPEINKEQKTKPSQQAFKLLRGLGIQPHIIVGRSEKPLNDITKEKLSLYSNVSKEFIFSNPNVETIYEVPIYLYKEGLPNKLAKLLSLEIKPINFSEWEKRIRNIKEGTPLRIGIVGKYTENPDSYASLVEAIKHSSAELKIKPNIIFHNAEKIVENEIRKDDLTIIAGGFGKRGIEGKIKAIEIRRKEKKPILGICLGMQLMVVEYAKNVLGWKNAHSLEFCENCIDVVTLLPNQKNIKQMGGSMRLGSYEMNILENTKLYEAYNKKIARERHRHRYEINPKYVKTLESKGLVISAYHKNIVEAIEYKESLGIGIQSHPEFKSRFENPHPLFTYMLKNSLTLKNIERKTVA